MESPQKENTNLCVCVCEVQVPHSNYELKWLYLVPEYRGPVSVRSCCTSSPWCLDALTHVWCITHHTTAVSMTDDHFSSSHKQTILWTDESPDPDGWSYCSLCLMETLSSPQTALFSWTVIILSGSVSARCLLSRLVNWWLLPMRKLLIRSWKMYLL